ncbi:MAG: hypothetical protein V3R25_07265 [Nitrosomonadaceae bacterium]
MFLAESSNKRVYVVDNCSTNAIEILRNGLVSDIEQTFQRTVAAVLAEPPKIHFDHADVHTFFL